MEYVNHPLSPNFSNAGLDNYQNIRAVPMVELIGMDTKHLIFDALTVPGIIFMDEEKGVKDSFETPHVEGILAAGRGRH